MKGNFLALYFHSGSGGRLRRYNCAYTARAHIGAMFSLWKEGPMKKHKFWAWAMVFCAFMTMYTGHKKA